MQTKDILRRWTDACLNECRLNQIPEILYRMNRGELERQQLVEVITVRYQVAHFFEAMLEQMLRVIDAGRFREKDGQLYPDVIPALRHAVAQNLREERGEAEEYGGPHAKGRAALLQALGVDYAQWQNLLGTYEHLGALDEFAKYAVTQLKYFTSLGGIEAVSILWHYEWSISRDGVCGDYCVLLRAFEHAFPEFANPSGLYREGDPLWHLYSHARHDEYHAELAEQALVALDGKRGLWGESIQLGIQQTYFILRNFWNGLSERHCGAFDRRAHWRHERLVA
jgi:hypothetical protein